MSIRQSSSELRILSDQMSTHKQSQSPIAGRSGSTAGGATGDYINSQTTLKIAILGPKASGKTRIANLIDTSRPISQSTDYDPTVGVRILQFEENINARSIDNSKNALLTVNVELWDVSGSDEYESCWPAIADRLDGAIILFDPTSKDQANDVRVWAENFIKLSGFKSNGQLIIWAQGTLDQIHKPLNLKLFPNNPNSPTLSASIINININKSINNIPIAKTEFQNFLGGVYVHNPTADLDSFVQ